MVFHRIGEFVPNLVREILGQFAGEIGIVRHAGGQQVIVKRQLGVGEQHGEFRPGQGLAAPGAFGDRDIVRQELHGAVKEAALLERLHQAGEEAGLGHALAFGQRKRQRLQIIVAQHQRADLVGHRGKQAVAVIWTEASIALGARQRDLDD